MKVVYISVCELLIRPVEPVLSLIYPINQFKDIPVGPSILGAPLCIREVISDLGMLREP